VRAEEKYEKCVQGLKGYVEKAGFTDVVLGLSGGIDSALVAVMCFDAFEAGRVHAVLLPGPYTSAHSVDDAEELAGNLGISTETISILEPYQAFCQAFLDAGLAPLEGLAAENAQARCRMVCLMALSNTYRWMLVNTGNKSESLVGYSTLYGDMAGAYAPLGGLYKTEVYELSRWRNAFDEARGRRAPIPCRILEKAPSAELAPGQEDEKSLGLCYDELDRILSALVDEGKTTAEAAAMGHDERQVERIAALLAANAFKQPYQPPFPSFKGVCHGDV